VLMQNASAERIDLAEGGDLEANGLCRQIDAANARKKREAAHREHPFMEQQGPTPPAWQW